MSDKLSQQELVQIANLHCTGSSIRAIASELGRDKDTVQNAIKNNTVVKDLITQFRDGYSMELMDGTMREMRNLLDNMESIPVSLRIQILALGLKYSFPTRSEVDVKKNTTVNIGELSLDELASLGYK